MICRYGRNFPHVELHSEAETIAKENARKDRAAWRWLAKNGAAQGLCVSKAAKKETLKKTTHMSAYGFAALNGYKEDQNA